MLANNSATSIDTTANVAGDAVGMSENAASPSILPRFWFIAYVDTNTERSVRQHLTDLGYESYVASQNEVRVWKNGRRKLVERVVITNVIFIHATEQERRLIVNFPFIKSFMVNRAGKTTASGHRPLAHIPDSQMAELQQILELSNSQVQFATSHFLLGDYVQVLGVGAHPFNGYVVRLVGDNRGYVGVRLDYLGCAYIEVPAEHLVKLSSPTSSPSSR